MPFNLRRRDAARLLAVALAAAGTGLHVSAHDDDDDGDRGGLRSGKLFISTNAVAGNEVLVFQRRAEGPATLIGRVATQGLGTGAGLGSQGAVTLSRNGRWLFVVNAGSHTLSTFALTPAGLVLRSVVDSGGLTPTSVTEHDGRVFVLNAGGSGGIAGFRNHRGTLVALPQATGTLSANTGTAPGQVGFSDDGDVLVVTERATQRLTSFRVSRHGALSDKTVTPSAGAVPFGFAFNRRDTLIVSEAAGSSVASYRFAPHAATPVVVTASLPNGQGAACWIAVTPDGRHAYSSNAATSTISSYAVARDGSLSLVAAVAGFNGAGAGALDAAVSGDGAQLHVLAPRALQIVAYRVERDGTLTPLGQVGGMPAGAAGLAAN